LDFLRIPAVSIKLKSNPKRLYRVLLLSLVVPAVSVTTYLSSSSSALINEDLPAFGLPTTAKPGKLSLSIFFLSG